MERKKFTLPHKKIEEFCKRWSIDPKAHIGLFEIAEMKIELEKMFKRPVDLVEKRDLSIHIAEKRY